ncbi:peptidase [Singulisphaera sp. Ch08]|uniref:Peptidase n=1 Tax=Singulisphaera sp. Ch08 TaxID=3120278 RepID=A0AAU7CR72_9BACT
MTYCVGIKTREGLVMASDSRSNASYDQVNICRKMHSFVDPGERVFVLLTSGSLSCSQSVLTLLRRDFDQGAGLATAGSLYDAARIVGDQVRRVSAMDRQALEQDAYKFNVHILLAGQIRGQPHDLYLIYPQGNPLQATEDSPFLQIGECKYGRPILDRGVRYDRTTLEDAARYALISLDSTMRSNVTVGPPIDLLVYTQNELMISRQRRFMDKDPDLLAINAHWEQALRRAVQELPPVRFNEVDTRD